MGKPFKNELSKIKNTIQWALEQPTEKLTEALLRNKDKPLFVVGSGGALSACYYAASLFQKHGKIAKAITPLELYYTKEALHDTNIMFISSEGRNKDILFGFKTAICEEPTNVLTLSLKKNSPLEKLASKYTSSQQFAFANPAGKDGFLATNSLVAFFVILSKSFGYLNKNLNNFGITNQYLKDIKYFVTKLTRNHTIIVLYGGWGQSVAFDIESKFTEAALGSILLSDYRNFGHGRHHWFDKRGSQSAIIALVTPEEEKIADKTLSLIPSEIPKLVINSDIHSPSSSIELLLKSFYLVDSFGEFQNIDPGRPGVPEYGSKLYHLNYSSFYKAGDTEKLSEKARISIQRKIKTDNISLINNKELKYWVNKYEEYLALLRNTNFSCIILDYDGTICPAERRFLGPDKEILNELNSFLGKGFLIGIATGRGQSIRNDLQKFIDKRYWKNVIIGYYNGSDIASLDDNEHPNKDIPPSESLTKIKKRLDNMVIPFTNIVSEIRPFQITIQVKDKNRWNSVKSILQNAVMSLNLPEPIQLLESSHSIDIVISSKASKLNVIEACKKRLIEHKTTGEIICIGDRGQWPGNDFEILSTKYSLSVNEVTEDSNSCWNLAGVGIKNDDATLYYLKCIKFQKKHFNFYL